MCFSRHTSIQEKGFWLSSDKQRIKDIGSCIKGQNDEESDEVSFSDVCQYINEKEMMLCQVLGIGGTSAQGDKHFSFIETLTGMYSYTRAQTYIKS